MEYWIFFTINTLGLLLMCHTGDAKATLNLPDSIYFNEPASGDCTVSSSTKPRFLKISSGDDNCKVKVVGKIHGTKKYQQNFTVTCSNSSASSVKIQCFNIGGKTSPPSKVVQVREKPGPTITCPPQNFTIKVGLPVTLTCYVEGDPNHYWVGWMSRHTLIQGGEKHSISTSPNFKSSNGTIHHLTIHSVKEAGKYHCNVYTMSNKVVDQVTHQVDVDNGNNNEIPSSYFSIINELF